MKVCPVCQRCFEDKFESCVEDNHGLLIESRKGGREIFEGCRLDFLTDIDHFTETYLATDMVLDEPRLIKIFSPSADIEAPAAQQILTEAKTLETVNHPNVVRIFESGKLETGEFYVVTEKVEGKPLRQCLNVAGLISELTAIMVARQVAEGLQALHEVGLAHRSINPENIILANDIENRLLIKIGNPDLAAVNRRLVMAEPDEHLSDLKYFAPELFAIPASDILSDIYSLGIVLHEMLAGQTPFDAQDAAGLIEKHQKENPQTPPIFNFDIRALLSHTLSTSLQKLPAGRLKTAQAFARQLRHIEQLITHMPIPAQFETKPAASETTKPKIVEQPKTTTPVIVAAAIPDLPPNNNLLSTPVPDIIEKAPVEARPLVGKSQDAQSKIAFRDEAGINPEPAKADASLIEWKQPDDIPSEIEVLKLAQMENVHSKQETEITVLQEDEFLEYLPETEPVLVSHYEHEEMEERSVSHKSGEPFSSYADAPAAKFIPDSRVFAGAGLLVLLVLAGSIFWFNRPARSTAAQLQTKNHISEKNIPRLETKKPDAIPEPESLEPESDISSIPDFKMKEPETSEPSVLTKRLIKDSQAKTIKTSAPAAPKARESSRPAERPNEKAEPKQAVAAPKKTNVNIEETIVIPLAVKKSAPEKKPVVHEDVLGRPRIVKF
jgi:serine/threonine protein kinase